MDDDDMASALPPMVDLRFFSKPPSFGGKSENFSGWRFLVVNYLTLVNDAYPDLLDIVSADPSPCGMGADDLIKQLGLC